MLTLSPAAQVIQDRSGIPSVGLGTFGRTGEEGTAAILKAIELGYRHLDTAQSYGTEGSVGEAVRRSGLPRADFFITTKVGDARLDRAQFLPKREDVFGADEYEQPELQLHRHVMYHTQPGDMMVVDARGDLRSGIFGEMMLTCFKVRGVGCVIDGCLRDAEKIDIDLWTTGLTPNLHAQTDIMPYGLNVPIACGGVFVIPGDIVVGDDDGAIVVPVSLAEKVIEKGSEHHDWEEFVKMRLEGGGDMRLHYPLTDVARPEYEAWRAAQGKSA